MNLNKSNQGPTRWTGGWSTWGEAMRTGLVQIGHDAALKNFIAAWQYIIIGYQEDIAMLLLRCTAGGQKKTETGWKRGGSSCIYRTTFFLWGQPSSRRGCPEMLLEEISLDISRCNWIKPWAAWSEFHVDCCEQEVGLEISWGPFQLE